ncbi:MAG: PAAR domain-containing protein [Phycisphaerae bacterium]
MFPAARLLDPITHDMLVPCGVIIPPIQGPPPNPVLIEGLPAAFVTCRCACSGVISAGIVHPPIPDPNAQPPIVMGSMTVMINNFPAARWSPAPDIGVCGVFLGDPKLAATRTTLIGG